MDFLKNNAELIRKRGNVELSYDHSSYICETARDGQEVIKVSREGKDIYLGSKYNNESIIDKYIQNYDLQDGDAVYIVLGFGTAYHIERLLKSSEKNKILVLEPDVNVIKTAAENRDLRNVLNDSRVSIYVYSSEQDIIDIFEKEIDRSYPNYIYYSYYANYEKAYTGEIELAAKMIKFLLDMMLAVAKTNICFKETVLNNYFMNMPEIVKSQPSYQLFNKFSQRTAVIVSSGPSLKKNIGVLKDHQHKVIIICAGRSLKELLDNGIRPDFVCAVDPGPIMKQLMEPVLQENIPMVCFDQINGGLIKEYRGKKLFFINSLMENMSHIAGRKFDVLPVGGSVAHLCTAFAVYLGVKNVVFIGQDLAYTDNKYHSENSSNEKLIGSAALVETDGCFYVEGNVEEKVLTSRSFNIFRTWFEMFIKANKQTRFINCTEGGAKIAGTDIMKLQDFFDKMKDDAENDLSSEIDKILSQKLNINFSQVEKRIISFKDKLLSLKSKALEGIKYSEELLNHYKLCKKGNINGILTKLDRIDLEYTREEEITYFINLCAYEQMKNIAIDKKLRARNGETERDGGMRIALRNAEIYKGYIVGIDMMLSKFEPLLAQIEKEKIQSGE